MYSQLMVLTLIGMTAFGQSAPPKESPKSPRIGAEMRARFWRAQAEAMAAAAKARQAQEAAKAAQEEMQKECGDKFVLAVDPAGEPFCEAKK